MKYLFAHPLCCKLSLFLFLILAVAGPTSFPTPTSADKMKSAFSELDAELALLIKNRNSLAIRRLLEGGRVPADYLFEGKIDLILLFADYKLVDLFEFVASRSMKKIAPEQLVHIFRNNNNFPHESAQIVRYYIISKYDKDDNMKLDFYDSLFLGIIMCDVKPFAENELKYIFDDLRISVDMLVYKEVSSTLSQKDLVLDSSHQCLRYVRDQVESHVNEILDFRSETSTGDLK